jgi:hypothetical protein
MVCVGCYAVCNQIHRQLIIYIILKDENIMKVKVGLAKTIMVVLFTIPSCVFAATPATPASQAWVLDQINKASTYLEQLIGASGSLTPQNWNAICTSGSPTSASGCFGNLSSAGFSRVNSAIGTYTTLGNVPVANVSNSVFVKQFFAGTNMPVSGNEISVTTGSSDAVCGLFTVTGTSLGDGGVINSTPSNDYYPYGQFFINIGSGGSTSTIQYFAGTAGGMVTTAPIYVLCLGYNYTSGTPPVAAALGSITAV